MVLAYFYKDEVNQALEDYTKALELKPNYAQAYYNRARIWLHQQEWEKARKDLTAAMNRGMDITAVFRNDYQGVAGFQRKTGVELPGDVAAMLIHQVGQTLTHPVVRNLFEPQKELDLQLFENITAMLIQQAEQASIPLMTRSLFQPENLIEEDSFENRATILQRSEQFAIPSVSINQFQG